jgi:galactose oxidase-like protein
MTRRNRRIAILVLAAIVPFALVVGLTGGGRTAPSPETTPSPSGSSPGGSGATATTTPPSSGSAPASTSPPSAEPSDLTVTWTQLSPGGTAPAARQGHTWTVDPDAAVAYLFGGQTGPDAKSALADLWAYDLGADAWERARAVGPAPPPRSGHVAAWIDGVGLIVVGGRGTDGRALPDAWRFDPNISAWQALPTEGAALPARSDACAAVDQASTLWTSHGLADGGTLLRDTWRYQPGTGRWDQMSATSPPAGRAGHVCWFDEGGRFLLFGGAGSGTGAAPFGDLWAIDGPATAGQAWTRLAAEVPFGARTGAALAIVAGRAVIGGGLDAGGRPTSEVGVLATEGDTIVRVPPDTDQPAGRTRSALVDDPASERLLLFGGATVDGVSGETWQAVVH